MKQLHLVSTKIFSAGYGMKSAHFILFIRSVAETYEGNMCY